MTSRRNSDGLGTPFERDPEVLAMMGQVVSIWGTVSNLTRQLAARQLSCDPVQADKILQTFGGEEKRLEFIARLVSSKPASPENEAILTALNRLKKLAPGRNLIVHGGPIHGAKKDVRPLGLYFVDFRYEDEMKRYVAAKPFLTEHLAKLKERGGILFDLLYPKGAPEPPISILPPEALLVP
jgi:hypothetical protein